MRECPNCRSLCIDIYAAADGHVHRCYRCGNEWEAHSQWIKENLEAVQNATCYLCSIIIFDDFIIPCPACEKVTCFKCSSSKRASDERLLCKKCVLKPLDGEN